jgi:hypothetical protein
MPETPNIGAHMLTIEVAKILKSRTLTQLCDDYRETRRIGTEARRWITVEMLSRMGRKAFVIWEQSDCFGSPMLSRGTRVIHAKLGRGVCLESEHDAGVEVIFDGHTIPVTVSLTELRLSVSETWSHYLTDGTLQTATTGRPTSDFIAQQLRIADGVSA